MRPRADRSGRLRDAGKDVADRAAERWAASGMQALTDPAVEVPVRLVERTTSLVAALDRHGAALGADFAGEGLGILAERAALLGLPRGGATSAGGATRLVRAADRWIAVALPRRDDVELVPAWLGDGGDASVGQCRDGADEATWRRIDAAVAARPAAELVERAGLLGLACSAVGETSDRRPVLAERREGAVSGRRPDGLIVADLASLWAGPLAGRILARCGARVITVESTTRPDGARATPAFFEALHEDCESVALPFDTAEGRSALRKLLRRVDVVIEGSRPRALRQLGIDACELIDAGPSVWVSITAHGRAEPLAQRVGFGDDTAAAGGLVGWVEERPVFVGDAVTDPLTGLTTAAAVIEHAERGGRWLIDIALARVAAAAAPRPGDPVVASRPAPASPRRSATHPGGRTARDRSRAVIGVDTDRVVAELGVRT